MKIGNKMVKALAVLSFALLCVFALLVPSFAEGEVARVYDAENTEVGVFQTLNGALDAVTEGGAVELLGNTTLEGTKTEADGYAYVTDEAGRMVDSVKSLQVNDVLMMTFSDGVVKSEVQEVVEEEKA